MYGSCFDEETLRGENAAYQAEVDKLHDEFGVEFVAMGPTAFIGAPLKWVYCAGATNERFKRISLAPGHGIGGIVVKSGKPMKFTNIEDDLDPREYSSYPIVFAEGLSSFCCLPLLRDDCVVGALLLAFRTSSDSHSEAYRACADYLGGSFCDLAVVSEDYLSFDRLVASDEAQRDGVFMTKTDVSHVITAQEEERRRISRELHDGLAQELLTVSMQLDLAYAAQTHDETLSSIKAARARISSILDEIHDISVNLRPSTLDHFGLLAALRSQAAVYQQTYGVVVAFSGTYGGERFDAAHEIQIYRIAQEAMLNACKYSGKDEIKVVLDEAGGWISVSVIDRGTGFDVDDPPILGSGCGLPGMRERVKLIGGTLNMESGAGGTTITLIAPLLAQKESEEDQG